jgi:DNA-binding CsgD family transcriptional regulator
MAQRLGAIVGRGTELARIARFLDDISDGPGFLVIEGEAGIGKTTLLQAGVDEALERGVRVLATRCGESETTLSLSGLGDLLGPFVDEALPELPGPLAAAIEAALLRVHSADSTPDRRAVSLAALEMLRIISARGPTLLAIDDLQWLDQSSARVLEFCARRIHDEQLGILASLRIGTSGSHAPALLPTMPGTRSHRLAVGSMSRGELGGVIRARLEAELPQSIVRRVHVAAGGNPFYAVEIAREVLRRGVPAAGEALPVPDDLSDLLRHRVTALPVATQRTLLVAASTSHPTRQLVRDASGLDDRGDSALAPAESAGVVHPGGDVIRFAHPLLASAVYASATTEERRRVHAQLAEYVEHPEERARHLALSSAGPDAQISSELDEAADLARRRGAPDSAAELAELGRRLTPVEDVDELRRRTVQAAEDYFDSGDATRAWALLEEAVAAAPWGHERAQIVFRLAAISWLDIVLVQELTEQARLQAEGDAELLAATHDHLAWAGIYRGDLEAASHHAEASMDYAHQITATDVRANTLTTSAMVGFLTGRPPQTLMVEADRLQDLRTQEEPGIESISYTGPRIGHGLQLLWAGDLSSARATLERELRSYEKQGRYLLREEILCYLAELECRAGNLGAATRAAEESAEIVIESGRVSGILFLFPKALLAAHRGAVDEARSTAQEGLRRCLQYEDFLDANRHRSVLGFVELSLGNPAGAHEWLAPVVDFLEDSGVVEPGVIACAADEIEALIGLGKIDRAERLLTPFEARARSLNRPWAIATAGRCRALLLAASGDLESARTAIELALKEHQGVGQPLELGRTLLLAGEIERRSKQKRTARASLQEALQIFEQIDAPLWGEKARVSLQRVGGIVGEAGELTPTERRVAELAAAGMTNREVAQTLFVSVKSVEANLSRVYAKLGIRSRTQLARRMS